MDKSVKDYLRLITAEQLQARITPKQATPFFDDKLTQLSFHLDQKLASEDLSPTQRFIVARDQAYFKCVFFSGDRPGDLGRVKVLEILRFPNDDGFLFNHVWGKTLRDGDENGSLSEEILNWRSARLIGLSSTWLWPKTSKLTSQPAIFSALPTLREALWIPPFLQQPPKPVLSLT